MWQYKRDEVLANNAYFTTAGSESFKHKAGLTGKIKADDNAADSLKRGVKIAVPLIYLSIFWRSLEMPLINCKVHLALNSIENCVLSSTCNF